MNLLKRLPSTLRWRIERIPRIHIGVTTGPQWCGKAIKTYMLQENCWWSLDSYLTPIILDALKHYIAQERLAIPLLSFENEDFDSETGTYSEDAEKRAAEKWRAMLDEALNAFQLLYDEENGVYVNDWKERPDTWLDEIKERDKQIAKGLQTFATIYRSLWD